MSKLESHLEFEVEHVMYHRTIEIQFPMHIFSHDAPQDIKRKPCDLLFTIIRIAIYPSLSLIFIHWRIEEEERRITKNCSEFPTNFPGRRRIEAGSKMKGSLPLLLCLTAASGFVLKVEEDELQWEAWKSFHGKSYATESEEAMRRAIWRDNLQVRYKVD